MTVEFDFELGYSTRARTPEMSALVREILNASAGRGECRAAERGGHGWSARLVPSKHSAEASRPVTAGPDPASARCSHIRSRTDCVGHKRGSTRPSRGHRGRVSRPA